LTYQNGDNPTNLKNLNIMRTLSMILCFFICCVGLVLSFTSDITAGAFLLIIGSLAFLVIGSKSKKVAGYNPNHWMNK
jgi:ABC-type Mn2+/Zn2+ transport system permease subunit